MTETRAVKAVITGASGFVGPHLSAHLAAQGDDVVAADTDNAPDLLDHAGWKQFLRNESPDVVYHLAGWSDVGASWHEPIEAFKVNAEGTLSILEAARHADVGRVIVVSSADVYGIASPASLPLLEDAPVQPRSPYGASKEAAEAVARQYHRGWGLDVIIVRPFNHIGPGQSPRFVAPAIAAKVAAAEVEGGGLVTHGDLSPERDFTDVRDVVRAYRLIAKEGRAGATYNVCTGRAVPMSTILDHFVERATVEVTTEPDLDLIRPVDLPVLRGSHAALTEDTGWEPSIPLSESLDDILNDARSRLGG